MARIKDLTGLIFGNLTVLEYAGNDQKGRQALWLCQCSCGQKKIIRGYCLTRKIGTKSCGCLNTEAVSRSNSRHKMVATRTYDAWRSMKSRCYSIKNIAYKNYGGRGISVCQRWLDSFESFLSDMGEMPENKTLDRIDSNGNYEPVNCRWADSTQQNRNRRDNILIEYQDQIKCVKEWSILFNIEYRTLLYRLKVGWSVEDALLKPSRRHPL